MTTNLDFSGWLESEIKKRNWIPADLARESGVGADVISRLINRGRKKASDETLTGIAKAFNYPPDFVFRMAGLLPPDRTSDPTDKELLHLFDQLTETEKKEIMEWIRFKVDKKRA